MRAPLIRPGSVKICSLRETEHARFVCEAGADLFGLIFVPGARRRVTIERASDIVAAARAFSGSLPLAVGVFVGAGADEINRAVRDVGLDLVQLHGSELPDLIAKVDAPVIKALRPEPGEGFDQIHARIGAFEVTGQPPAAYLLDGFDQSQLGGAGVRTSWNIAAEIASQFPVILAGGLTPENVGDAVRTVGPIAVDVSSGVETDGSKDRSKIARFVSEARAGFRREAVSV